MSVAAKYRFFIFLSHWFLAVYGDEDVTCEQRTNDGKCCVLPFTYEGQETYFCTRGGPSNFHWCATTDNYDRDGEWGICSGKHKIAIYSLKVILSAIFLHLCEASRVKLNSLQSRHWLTRQGNKRPLCNTSSQQPRKVNIWGIFFFCRECYNNFSSRLQEKIT